MAAELTTGAQVAQAFITGITTLFSNTGIKSSPIQTFVDSQPSYQKLGETNPNAEDPQEYVNMPVAGYLAVLQGPLLDTSLSRVEYSGSKQILFNKFVGKFGKDLLDLVADKDFQVWWKQGTLLKKLAVVAYSSLSVYLYSELSEEVAGVTLQQSLQQYQVNNIGYQVAKNTDSVLELERYKTMNSRAIAQVMKDNLDYLLRVSDLKEVGGHLDDDGRELAFEFLVYKAYGWEVPVVKKSDFDPKAGLDLKVIEAGGAEAEDDEGPVIEI